MVDGQMTCRLPPLFYGGHFVGTLWKLLAEAPLFSVYHGDHWRKKYAVLWLLLDALFVVEFTDWLTLL